VSIVATYAEALRTLLEELFVAEHASIERAAQLAAESIASGGVLHIFGTGHSHMIALEAFGRAGGLAAVNAIVDFALTPLSQGRDGVLERLHGYADVLLETEDLRAGEVVVVVSNSGINAVPIEFALGCKQRGLHVVAVTSLTHSRSSPSRHASGRKLYEVADLVIDNHGPSGDAAISLTGDIAVGPTSTVAGAAIVNALTARIAQLLTERGVETPVLGPLSPAVGLRGLEQRQRRVRRSRLGPALTAALRAGHGHGRAPVLFLLEAPMLHRPEAFEVGDHGRDLLIG
jgi:uncharacterized phosphosugar-binding protein